MNIRDFQYHINKTILDRGYNYYIDGNIVESYKQGDNEYIFHVEGSDYYEVLVEIGDNGDILSSYCDCPYDFGPLCKHEAAAYFKAFDMLHHENDIEQVSTKSSKRETVQVILNNLSKQELINIIVNLALDDATLEKSLLFKYGNGDEQQELKACQELINTIVRKYTGREGFIKYRDTSDFVSELEGVIEKARNMENVLVAVDIALLLLGEAINAFSYADDSSGNIGSLAMESLELIEEIVSRCDNINNQRVEVFEKLLAQTDNKIFDDWSDYRTDLLNICSEFANDEKLRERFIIKIESILDNNPNDYYSKYENERLLQLLFKITEKYGNQKEAEQFIHEHLQFSSFREKLLNRYLHEKNYEKVIELAKDGEKQDQELPGLLLKWKKYHYKALQFLSLKEEQRILAKELFFNGEFDYYQDLKELAANQNEFYTNFKLELKKRAGWHAKRLFLKLIEEENDLDEILEFVRDNPIYIEDYAEKLVKPFKEDTIEIYTNHIKSIASTSSNRKEYQGVCHKLTRYKKIAGKQKQVELINEFKVQFRKRPAFIDELGRI
ncbi:SWIM zinc finger family protein [Pseudogracilibacillus sp. SO30301A]|uniref:SWIM zinc finger family protein n=1 Tax=Pseudogracilibacillus sp. SO30301A TaxID=3098291 RepID=UPI00300E3B42